MNNRNTSNTANNQLAAIWKMIPDLEGNEVLDIGCGRYYERTLKHCIKNNVARYTPYDKYANVNELPVVGEYDIIVIANVLNVIEEAYEMQEVLTIAKDYLRITGTIYIQIYEGNKSGIGKETTRGYQRNEATENYIAYIKETFTYPEYLINQSRNIITIEVSPF